MRTKKLRLWRVLNAAEAQYEIAFSDEPIHVCICCVRPLATRRLTMKKATSGNSPLFWESKTKEGMAMLLKLNAPTFFLRLSPVEKLCPELLVNLCKTRDLLTFTLCSRQPTGQQLMIQRARHNISLATQTLRQLVLPSLTSTIKCLLNSLKQCSTLFCL